MLDQTEAVIMGEEFERLTCAGATIEKGCEVWETFHALFATFIEFLRFNQKMLTD